MELRKLRIVESREISQSILLLARSLTSLTTTNPPIDLKVDPIPNSLIPVVHQVFTYVMKISDFSFISYS